MSKEKIITDIIMYTLISVFTGLCFMGFMYNFNAKRYFIAGTYICGICSCIAMIIKLTIVL